ncbi:MAG: helix-turn-helix domain-containing protein [Cyclobacteriaceae bacterium]
MSTAGVEYIEGAVYLVAIQLLIIALLNLFAGKKQNLILGFFLLVFVDTARSSFVYYHLDNQVIQILAGNFHPNFFFGPFLYLYLRAIVTPDLSRKTIFSHLILPFLIIIAVPAYVFSFQHEFDHSYRNIFLYETRFMITTTYYVLGLRLIYMEHAWKNVKQERRYRSFFLIVASYLLIGGLLALLNKYLQFMESAGAFYVDAIIYLGMFIYLVYYGITELNWMKNLFVKSKPLIPSLTAQEMYGDLPARFNRIFTEEKIHSNPKLNMEMLADELQTNTSVIRDYLTVKLKTSFYSFINEKRVEEFKKNLFNKQYEHLDLTGIAYASGFSSKATFNRAFKRIEGITPREFREKTLNGQ